MIQAKQTDTMTEHPWRDKETLQRLYFEEGLNQEEIAEKLGCTRRTISEWFGRLGLEGRQGRPRKERAQFYTTVLGYERWHDKHPASRDKTVRVHRLMAVSEWGFEAVRDKHVHHKNRIKWDNRMENLEVMSPSEHARHHVEEGHSIGNEDGLIAQYGEEAVLDEKDRTSI